MPFFKLDFTTETTLNLVETNIETLKSIKRNPSPDRVPIFLIPSLGNGGDLVPLALRIFQQTDRLICAYFDSQLVPPQLANSTESFESTSLEDKAKEMAENIKKFLPKFYPAIIVSDKYACDLSLKVAQHLAKQNKDTFLYLIDGATADVSKDYLQNKPEQTTEEMWEIILSAGKKCELDLDEVEMDADELEKFSKMPFEIRFDSMAKKIISMQKADVDELKLKPFKDIIQVANHHLQLIYNYKNSPQSKSISSHITIQVLLTEKTKSTFGHLFCGWDQYINPDNIDNATSYDKPLENNCSELSEKIIRFISDHISKKYLLGMLCGSTASVLKKYPLEDSEANSLINEACTALYKIAKEMSPSNSNVNSPVLPNQEKAKNGVISANINSFFRKYHSVPIISPLDKVSSDQIETNTSTQQKVVVLA